jgi:hypothetical protein
MKSRLIQGTISCAALVLFSIGLARGAVIHKDVSELTAESNRIIIGDVVEVTSFWNQDRTLIKSRIVIDVDDYLIGEGTGTETLEMDGGTVDDKSLRVSVLPIFEVGDRVLLFLGDTEISLVGHFQGAYLTDGEQAARMAPGCREILSETLRPLSGLLDEIKQALPPGAAVPAITPYDGDYKIPPGALLYVLCGVDWTYQSNPMGENYKINANCQDGPAGDANSQRTQIQNGANAWNGAGADFEFTYGGTSNQTYVSFNGTNLVYFDTTPPGGGGYLAATYYWYSGNNMTECDMVFDDLHWTWWNGSGGCSGYFDIWSVAAHEFGHFLCLGHSGYQYATMYYALGPCETHARTLYFDDINGIIAIYGEDVQDVTPPSPDPMTFQSPPSATSPTAITMTATLATDDSPPIQYQFDFFSGGPGGTDRTWGTTRTYTDNGLTPNTEYSYRCRARDSASPSNETAYSSIESEYTLADVPGAPELTNVTTTTIDLNVDPNANPSYTTFAIVCGSTDPVWDDMFVNASGGPDVTEVWQTDDQWGTITVQGLSPGTEYSFLVKARNEENIETAYGPRGTETTLPDTPVPTLTEWGMIIMVLLLLTTGTIAILRRRGRVVARTI